MNNYERQAAELLHKAVNDGKNRNYETAVKKLKKVLGLTDKLPEALLYLGRSYHELGLFDDAVMAFRMFITKMPKTGAGYFYLGRTYIADNNFVRAVSCFSESLKVKPNFGPALAYMGYALMRTGSSSKAVNYLGRAVEAEPQNKRIYTMYMNSIFVLSLKEFRSENFNASLNGLLFLETAGFVSVSTKLYIGIIYKEMKDFRKAAQYISEALSYNPEDELIKNILAELYIKTSMVDEALDILVTYKTQEEVNDFINSIDAAENSFAVSFWNKKDYRAALHFALSSLKKKRTADMHLLAGECLKNTGKYTEAFNHFCRAQEFDKSAKEPVYGQAVALWLQEEYQKMYNILDKFLLKNKDDDFALYYHVLCSSKLGIEYCKWQNELEKLLKAEEDPWLLNARGWANISENRNKNAISDFRKALKLQNSLKEAWDGLIKSLESSGNNRQLLTTLKNYLNIFKDDISARNMYANLLIEEKRFAPAAFELMKIISNSEPDISLLKKLAYCHRESGKYKDAVIIYRQILSNDPFNENYLKMLLYCMRKSGRDAETIPLLRRAVEEFKNPSIDLLLVYGASLYRNDFDEEALSVFQKCVYNGMNDWRVYKNLAIIYREKGLKDWSDMYLKKSEGLKKK